ncbi:hypothetical protein [Cellulomonas sp. RIT-PI-Y]|uniref:hypothetical protein n=1 Tax=Cellulomonas sp. RIT-PI-Y TaxID=3035297 RepID=UPI0021DB38CB|nr:hypothetical protein [Cellulomonas sp. RIT-PI-Y]
MLRVLLAAVIGMFATSVVLTVTEIDDGHWVWLPVTGTAMTLLLIVVSVVKVFAGSSAARVPDIEAADRDGRVFLAKILDVRATGSSINDNPVCEIRLLAQPRTRAAYQTSTRTLVNLGRLAGLQRGAIVVVAQPDADRPELTLLEQPPAHWQRLADTDSRLQAMDAAPEWTMPPARGRNRDGLLRIPAIVLVLAFVVGAGIRIWPVRDVALAVVQGQSVEEATGGVDGTTTTPPTDPAADDSPTVEPMLFQAAQTQQVIDDLVAASGVTQFTAVQFMPTYATADGLTSPDAVTTDSWLWRDGTAQHQGPELIQSDAADLPDELFDVTTVDWSLIEGLVAQLPALTGIDDPDPVVYVRRAVSSRVTTPVEFSLSTDDDYDDAWISADATGQIVEMDGGAPDSPAAQWEAANG